MRAWLIGLALLVGAGPAKGAPTLGELLGALQRPKTVSARFVQEKLHPAFTRPQRSEGTVELARPARMRLVYERPHQVELRMDGDRVTMSYPRSGRTQTLERGKGGQMDVVFDTLAFFVDADPTRLAEVYEVAVKAPATLVLVPKDQGMRKMIARIRAEVDVAQGVLQKVTLEQTDGSSTTFTFLEPRVDATPAAP
ncbi:MAG: outer membrane lipoprotein carrier protein LolA [Myxococcales bacterium]|nr:outer membrane lipoprotein carrier protein LolA [Myxococcales bacterium]